jgi:hypothetical protein
MACTPASSEDKSITLPTSSALPPVFNETLPRVPLIESPDATRRLPLPPASEEPVEMLTSPDLAITAVSEDSIRIFPDVTSPLPLITAILPPLLVSDEPENIVVSPPSSLLLPGDNITDPADACTDKPVCNDSDPDEKADEPEVK